MNTRHRTPILASTRGVAETLRVLLIHKRIIPWSNNLIATSVSIVDYRVEALVGPLPEDDL